MSVSDRCLNRNVMRRSSTSCHECEDARRSAASKPTYSEGGQHATLSLNGKNDGVEYNDPALQLGNIVVELDDGCVERIRMNDTESAEEVATKVCRKNDLPEKFIALLAEHIINRYPTRPVDQKKEQLTETSKSETKESTVTAKNQPESKTVKKKNSVTIAEREPIPKRTDSGSEASEVKTTTQTEVGA